MESIAIKVEVDEFYEGEASQNYSLKFQSNKSENEIQHMEDGTTPEGKKRRAGRPKKSEFEKKLKQRQRFQRFKAKHVNIGDQVERWAYLKCMTNTESDSDMAKLLIDFYIMQHPAAFTTIPGNSFSNTRQLGQCVSDADFVDERFGDGKVKIEVDVMENTGMISNSSTDSADEEITDVYNHIECSKNVLKIPEVNDVGALDCSIKSARLREKGFRPNYAAIEWKDDTDVIKDIKTDVSKGVKNTKSAKRSRNDPDFDIYNSDDFDGSDFADDDESGADLTDDVTGNRMFEENDTKVDKLLKRTSNKRKVGSRRKIMQGASTKKQKKNEAKNEAKNEPEKPWIKIHLADHEDKYQTETMESFERKNRGIDASENLYSCLVCQHFKCSTKDVIENHLEKHINKVLECENCQYVGYCKTDIREHKMKCGNVVKALFVCEICGSASHSLESKRNHMGRVHDKPEWRCLYCPEMFKRKCDRLEHMRQIHPEMCQYCESCKQSKYQLSKEDFDLHKKSCVSREQCEICGELIRKGGMNKHVNDIHENVRKYQCEKCPYAAKSFKRLKTHLYSHDKIHPFSCDQCPFTCVQKYQLVSHMRTHTGEKPYKCTQCKYAAAWNVQLKEHVKVHGMDTAIKCENCEVVFKNETTRNMHLKKGQCVF